MDGKKEGGIGLRWPGVDGWAGHCIFYLGEISHNRLGGHACMQDYRQSPRPLNAFS